MSRVISSSSSSLHDSGGYRAPSLWTTVRAAGIRGLLILVLATVAAFAPLALLVWFQMFRLAAANPTFASRSMHVRSARHVDDSERDEPGETGLLQIEVLIPDSDGWRPLLQFDDPRCDQRHELSTAHVNRERVYIRPTLDDAIPFGLLGSPPVSVWLPEGSYELLVLHSPRGNLETTLTEARALYPLVAVRQECAVEDGQKSVVRVELVHHDSTWGRELSLSDSGSQRSVAIMAGELPELLAAIERSPAIPSLGGVVWALPEPVLDHADAHYGCTQRHDGCPTYPREWTQDQLATLRHWLPADAIAARARLVRLESGLSWRRFFGGWYCYAAAGVTGLVLTRWGTISLLEPHRTRQGLADAIWLLVVIFFAAAGFWVVFFN